MHIISESMRSAVKENIVNFVPRRKQSMKKDITMSLAAFALLLTGLFVGGCSSSTGSSSQQPGTHSMGSAPMSNAKHPGKLPGQ
jgi:hypothetical protein